MIHKSKSINNNHNKPELETGTQFNEAYVQVHVLKVQLEQTLFEVQWVFLGFNTNVLNLAWHDW